MAEAESAELYVSAAFKPASLLPIGRHRESLLYTVDTHRVTIVVAATGSGKTTQLPQFLEQAGWCADGKVIAVTQVGLIGRLSVRYRKDMYQLLPGSPAGWQLSVWQPGSQKR